MSVVSLERVGSDVPLFQARENGCATCAGCGVKPPLIELPQIQGDLAHLEMSTNDQWHMLLNSWLKPLFMVIIVSVGCSVVPVTPMFELSLAAAAFLAGIVFCREIPAAALSVKEEVIRKEIND